MTAANGLTPRSPPTPGSPFKTCGSTCRSSRPGARSSCASRSGSTTARGARACCAGSRAIFRPRLPAGNPRRSSKRWLRPGTGRGASAPAVVPDEAVLAALQRAAARRDGLHHEAEKLARAVEPQLAVAGAQRMAVENHDGPLLAAGQALQPPEQIDLLARVQLLAEAARLAERRRIAKDKRTRGPLDRKSTRLNSSHMSISYAVFCL